MSCEIKTMNGETESILAKEINEKINQGNEKATEEDIKYLRSDDFIFDFGDYHAAHENQYTGEYESMKPRVDENGEPKLFFNDTANKYYFLDKNNQQIYYPLIEKGIRQYFTNQDIREIVSKIALDFFKDSKKDFDTVNLEDGESLDNLEKYIEKYVELKSNNMYEDRPIFAMSLLSLLAEDNIKELKSEILEFYRKISINLVETEDVEELVGEEGEATSRLIGISSFEASSKERTSFSTRLMLSMLTNPNTIGRVFDEPMFAKFNDVYGTLLSILPDIKALEGEDLFELMKSRISDFISEESGSIKSKGYLRELHDILSSYEFTEQDKNRFVQTFNITKNNHLQTDLKVKMIRDSDSEGNTIYDKDGKPVLKAAVDNANNKVITSKTISVSDSGGRTTQVKDVWMFNFQEKFQDDLGNWRPGALKAIESFVKRSKEVKTAREIYHLMKSTGFDISPDAFQLYLTKMKTDNSELGKETRTQDLIYGFQNLIEKIQKAINKNKPISKETIFSTSKMVFQAVKAQAATLEDGTDAMVRQGGKNLYVFSSPSYIDNTVALWKRSLEKALITVNEMKDDSKADIKKLFLLDELFLSSAYNKGSFDMAYLTGRVGLDGKATIFLGSTNKSKAKERLQLAQERLDNYDTGLFNQIKYEQEFEATTDVSINDYIRNDVEKTLSGDYSRTASQGDKSSERQIKSGILINASDIDHNGNRVLSTQAVNLVFNYFAAEYNRMIEAWNEVKNSEDGMDLDVFYHYKYNDSSDKEPDMFALNGNAFKSQMFEKLSPGATNLSALEKLIHEELFDENGMPKLDRPLTLNSVSPVVNQLKSYINADLRENIDETYTALLDAGVLVLSEKTGEIEITNIGKDVIDEYNKRYEGHSKDTMVDAFVADYYVNSIHKGIEYTKMFSGDIAFFKNPADYKKRIVGTYTDGLQLAVKPGEELFKVAVVKTVMRKSPFADLLKGEYGIGISSDKYDRIDSTDGQGYITAKRWKFIINGLGKWSDLHDSVYKKMNADTPQEYTEDELKIAAQPLKGVYWGRDGKGKPVFLKYSQAVLSKSVVAGSDLEVLYNKMVNEDVDEVITFGGIKVGPIGTTRIHDDNGKILEDFELNTFELNNKDWKLQQDLPTKNFKDLKLGTQIQKNIFGGLLFNKDNEDFFFDGKFVSGQTIITEIVKTVGGLTKAGYEKLSKEFSLDEDNNIKNPKAVYDVIIEDLKNSNGSKNVIKALEANMPFAAIPQSGQKLIYTFSSILNSRLIDLETNGGSFIQMANFGLNKTEGTNVGVKWASYAGETVNEPYKYLGEDGRVKVVPGGLLLPASFIAKYVPNWKEIHPDKLFGTRDANGNVITEGLIDSRILDNIVGYRIPNQGLASNDSFRVVGILPESQGDSIVAYTGITTKTGSDFDIDKLFLMMSSYNIITDSFEKIKDKLEAKYKGATMRETFRNLKKALRDQPNFKGDLSQISADMTTSEGKKEAVINATNYLVQYVLKNKNTSFSKEILKGLDIKVTKLKYVDSNNNSEEGLQNRLLELYKSVLTNPKVLDTVMTPIDIPIFSDFLNMLFEKEDKTGSLTTFDPIKDIELRYSFLMAKNGVAIEANALVDVNREGNIFFNKHNIGFGIVDENNQTVLDREQSLALSNLDVQAYIEMLSAYKKRKGENFDEEKYSKMIKSVPLADSLTAILNAFVDIVKDNYISKGNWSTEATNVGNLMIRAGEHPLVVAAFLAQPIIKELNKESSQGRGFTEEGGLSENKFRAKLVGKALRKRDKLYEKLYRSYYKIINNDSYIESLVEKVNEGEMTKAKFEELKAASVKNRVKAEKDFFRTVVKERTYPEIDESLVGEEKTIALDSIMAAKKDDVAKAMHYIKEEHDKFFNPFVLDTELDLFTLMNQILKKEDASIQSQVLSKYYSLKQDASTLKDVSTISRVDTTGKGKNINSLFKIYRLINKVFEGQDVEGNIGGVESRYNGTNLGHFQKSLDIMREILENNNLLFPAASTNIQNMFDAIVDNHFYGFKETEEFSDKLETSYSTYIMANFFNFTKEETEDIINNLPRRLHSFINKQEKDGGRKYFILDELFIKKTAKDKHATITLNNRKKDSDYEEEIIESWEDLMVDNPKLAEDLVKYSFITSGFNMNKSQFFTFIPYTYFIQQNINQRLAAILNTNQADFLDLFYRNNIFNQKLVPYRFTTTKEIQSFKNIDVRDAFISMGNGRNNKLYIKRKINSKVGDNVVTEDVFYALAGYGSYDSKTKAYSNPIYIRTNPAGNWVNDTKYDDYGGTGLEGMYAINREQLSFIKSLMVGDRNQNLSTKIEGSIEEAIERNAKALESSKVVGENIASGGSAFAKELTNPYNKKGFIYKDRPYKNAEHAYQTYKSGEFNQEVYDMGNKYEAPWPAELRLNSNKRGPNTYDTMVDVLVAKLAAHPELVDGIKSKGGTIYLGKSTHVVKGNDQYWGSNGDNMFLKAMTEAYQIVDGASKSDEVFEEKEEGSPKEVSPEFKATIQEVINNQEFIKLSEDETEYVNTKTGKKYKRVTKFISEEEIEETDILKSAQTIGTKVDKLTRDFFDGTLKDLSEYDVAEVGEIKDFLKELGKLKKEMEARGETILANDIVLYNDEIGVAGTVDLLSYDKNGVIRIYDMKTMRDNNFLQNDFGVSKYDDKNVYEKTGKTKEDGSPEYNIVKGQTRDSKREKHQKQLSLYRILLKNTHGLDTSELIIIPIELKYNGGDISTETLKLLHPLVKLKPLDVVETAVIEGPKEVIQEEKKETSTVEYKYYGRTYQIITENGIGVKVEGYKGAKANEKKLLDRFNSDPSMDFQRAESLEKQQSKNEKPNKSFHTDVASEVELFPGMLANEEQKVALSKIEEFLASNETEFLLEGAAGTGKTTVISKAFKTIKGKVIVGTTLADEARVNLNKSIPGSKTLASLLALVPDKTSADGEFRERNEKEEQEYRKKKGAYPIEKVDILVVDEISMVKDFYIELINKYKRAGTKVIYIGDQKQIPPIGQAEASIFARLRKTKNNASLTQRMRQKDESPILELTDKYIEHLDKMMAKETNAPVPIYENIQKFDKEANVGLRYVTKAWKAIEEFVIDYKQRDGKLDHVIFIIAENKDGKEYTKHIRNQLFGEEEAKEDYKVGEVIRVNTGFVVSEEKVIPNGFRGNIVAKKNGQKILGKYQSIILTVQSTNDKGVSVTEDLMTLKGEDLINYKKDLEALAKEINSNPDAAKRASRFATEFYPLKESIVDLGYNYAITTHKVQGSTYNIAYVSKKAIELFNQRDRMYSSRMLNTAMSRPRYKLVVYDVDSVVKAQKYTAPKEEVEVDFEGELTEVQIKEEIRLSDIEIVKSQIEESPIIRNLIAELGYDPDSLDNLTFEEVAKIMEKLC